MTIGQIIVDLSNRGLLTQFMNFFSTFFGEEGLVSKGIATGIPLGLAPIVDFISENVDKEVKARCPCNVTANVTIPPILLPPTGNGSIPTVPTVPTTPITPPVSVPIVYSALTYVLPSRCSYKDAEKKKVCCDNGINSGCFTFDELNKFHANSLNLFCV